MGDCCYLAPAPCTPRSTKAFQPLLLPPAMLVLYHGLGHSIQNISCTILTSIKTFAQEGTAKCGAAGHGKPESGFGKQVREQMVPFNRSGSPNSFLPLQVKYPALLAVWGHLFLQDTAKLDHVLPQPAPQTAVVSQLVQKQ